MRKTILNTFLCIVLSTMVNDLDAKRGQSWDYTFSKLDFWTIPIAGGMTYLGHLNYYTTVNYSKAEILNYQNSKILDLYRFSGALEDFSHYWTIGLVGAGWLATGPLLDWKLKKFGTVVLMYSQMLMMERGLLGITQNVSRKPRPYIFDPSVSLDYKREQGKKAFMSFYSGHTSLAFANAFFWHDMIKHSEWSEKWKTYGTAFLYGSATAIGVMRYFSGQHFAQDILVGAAFGSCLAYASLKLHDFYDMEPYYQARLIKKVRLMPTANGFHLTANL